MVIIFRMLGRAALRWSRIAPVGARCAGGGGGHTDIPSIPATSGEIALPRDKNIFVPTPTPENISQETKDKWYPALGKPTLFIENIKHLY